MKKLIFILSLFLSLFAKGQVVYNGLGGYVPNGNYAGYYAPYMQGATKIAYDTTARNAIPSYYRDTLTFMCYTVVDSSFWILRGGIANSNYSKISTFSKSFIPYNAILQNGNKFGATEIIGTNDYYNVQINRGGTQALLIDTFGLTNTAGNFRINTGSGNATFYDFGASHTMQLPSDTPSIAPPILYTNLLAYKNGILYVKDTAASHSWNYGRLAYYRDLTGYGNTYSQGVTPSSSKVSIPFYNGTHSISYTNNAVMDSVTGAIYVNNKRLADTTQLLTVGSNITNTSGTISINYSNVVAALGYMPYNASNPSSYIAKSALSATNNSSTSIFSYNSTTGAYNFDSTKFAGNNLVYNAGLLGADTSTGATKLATQGYASRLGSNYAGLSTVNTFTTANYFKSIWANKDSIPITTGKTWVLVEDTATGQIKRQFASVDTSIATLTDGSIITWDVQSKASSSAVVTLAGTGRTLTISNPATNGIYTLKIIQDGTGSRTITTYPTTTYWSYGGIPTLTTTANAIDIISFWYTGSSKYYGVINLNMK